MSNDTEKHQSLLSVLTSAQGKGYGTFEKAVTDALAHVFEHLECLNAVSGPDDERTLKPGETANLR